jgi:hypothetical protein
LDSCFGTFVAFVASVAFVAIARVPLGCFLASYPYFVEVVVVEFALFVRLIIPYTFLHLQG